MVPPGLAASPFFSAAPAVPAPWVLASFADGIELVELPLAPVVPEAPPVAGVCCVVSLLGLVAAGPPRTSNFLQRKSRRWFAPLQENWRELKRPPVSRSCVA